MVHMANRKIDNKEETKRSTISFSKQHYDYLEKLAQEKKVSFAWIVRDAIAVYVAKNEEITDDK